MDVYSRMHSGKLYVETDEKLAAEQLKRLDAVFEYNNIRPSDVAARTEKLKSMFAEIGEGCYIETPFYSNWGGKHVHFGKRVYANYNLTLVDDTHIYVGDNVMFGPSVAVATAGHPLCVELREKFAQFNLPVRIEKNCWIGANAVILPGVTVGEGSVIGAGSVVTNDIPPYSLAVGTPCRVVRTVGEADRLRYARGKYVSEEEFQALISEEQSEFSENK